MAVYISNLYQFVGDARDYIYQPTTNTLPTSIDWRSGVSSIENQGFLQSCTANAMSGACELMLRSNGNLTNLSRLFNYYESRKHGGLLGTDNGAYLRDAIAVAAKVGFPDEALWEYNPNNLNTSPPSNVYSDASTRLLARYERIYDGSDWTWVPQLGGIASGIAPTTIGDATYIRDIKSALYEGYPVLVGMDLTASFQRITGTLEYQAAHPYAGVSATDPSIGAHAIVIIGYLEQYNAFLFANSWGSSWGHEGFGLLPFNNVVDVHEAWVLKGFAGYNILPSTNNPQYINPTIPDFTTPVVQKRYSDSLPNVSTLIQGSQVLNVLTTLTWVDIIFAKGFTGAVTLKVAFLASINKLRFSLEETVGDTLGVVNADAIMDAASGVLNPAQNAYTLPVYSATGAIIILKVNIASPEYLTFIQAALPLASRLTQTQSESLAFQYLLSAVSNLNSSANRFSGASLFDNAYLQVFNKRITMPSAYTGYMHFLNSGFNSGMWVRQTLQGVNNDLYLAVSNSVNDADFGAPVLIATNTGTISNPVYAYPNSANLNIPSLKYYFNAFSYGYQNSSTSPCPYLYATSADGSKFVFTVNLTNLNKSALVKEPVSFDMGSHYLGVYKSGVTGFEGLGGSISPNLVKPTITINPMVNITGVRVISTGNLISNSIRIKQRCVSAPIVNSLATTYPILDYGNRVLLSLSEDNAVNDPALYGAEVDVSESGTYIVKSQLGGSLTVVTNRLLYNPFFNGSEVLEFNSNDPDVFSAVSPTQVLVGSTEYQCIYIKNRNPTQTFGEVKIWVDLNCNNLIGSELNQQYLKLAMPTNVDRSGASVNNPTLGSKTQSPLGQVFNFANAESSALTILNLAPNESVPIWLKRVVNSSATLVMQDVLSYLRMKVKY